MRRSRLLRGLEVALVERSVSPPISPDLVQRRQPRRPHRPPARISPDLPRLLRAGTAAVEGAHLSGGDRGSSEEIEGARRRSRELGGDRELRGDRGRPEEIGTRSRRAGRAPAACLGRWGEIEGRSRGDRGRWRAPAGCLAVGRATLQIAPPPPRRLPHRRARCRRRRRRRPHCHRRPRRRPRRHRRFHRLRLCCHQALLNSKR